MISACGEDGGRTFDVEENWKPHETSSEMTVNKFTVFCTANTEMPFMYKRQVFDTAMSGAMVYSTEI